MAVVAAALSAIAVSMVGCGGGESCRPAGVAESRAISDEVHGDGIEGFFFLPPVAPDPGAAADGVFDGSLAPTLTVVVEAYEGTGPEQPAGTVVAEFTDTPSPRGAEDAIRADTAAEHYIVNFHTDRYDLVNGGTYRIFVRRRSEKAQYGFADVQLVANMKEAKSLTDNTIFALKDGRTLPIKFRIEVGAQPQIFDYKIAFVSNRSGHNEIYVMNSDGSGVTQVTSGHGRVGAPEWSPDCTEIAYCRWVGYAAEDDIHIVNLRDRIERVLFSAPRRQIMGGWSPDGKTIAYADNTRLPCFDVCIVNVDDPIPGCLTLEDGYTKDVHWSPDGHELIYTRGPVASPASSWIEIMDVETLSRRTLPQDSYSQQAPDFSPDQQKIVFGSNRYGSQDIFVMNADGTNVVALADEPNADELYPRFSPDGTRIAFESDQTGDREVYVMDADGRNCIQLTESPGLDSGPAWSPMRLPRTP